MKRHCESIGAFYAVLRAGLWEQSVRLSNYFPLDYDAIISMAIEQSVVGLVASGLEQIEDLNVPKQAALQILQPVVMIEGRNKAMNQFIADLAGQMSNAGIEAVLVKGCRFSSKRKLRW